MNFLAHFFLSGDDPAIMTGNFLADFLSHREVSTLPTAIQNGILLHRRIDQFTDSHQEVKKSVQRLFPRHHKYAPVLVDVYYDYFLIHNWDRYTGETLPIFCERAYAALRLHLPAIPLALHPRINAMIEADWLRSYGQFEGLQYTFDRMRKRTSIPEHLDGAVDTLLDFRSEMDLEFQAFFPDILDFVQTSA